MRHLYISTSQMYQTVQFYVLAKLYARHFRLSYSVSLSISGIAKSVQRVAHSGMLEGVPCKIQPRWWWWTSFSALNSQFGSHLIDLQSCSPVLSCCQLRACSAINKVCAACCGSAGYQTAHLDPYGSAQTYASLRADLSLRTHGTDSGEEGGLEYSTVAPCLHPVLSLPWFTLDSPPICP